MKENKYFNSLKKNGESSGTYKAYWAYRHTLERGTAEFEMSDFLWKNEVMDFIQALRKAGIKSFVYTNASTSTITVLHLLVENGCKMEGLYKLTRPETPYSDEEEVPGIRFTLD